LEGARSGLWSEIARLVGELRPQYVIVENVSALLSRGLGRVLGNLAEIGYDAEWHCIPASAVGAPHRRDRIWIIAYPTSKGLPQRGSPRQQEGATETGTGLVNESQRRGFETQIMDIAQRVGCEPWRNDNCQHDGDQFGATGKDASILADAAGLGRTPRGQRAVKPGFEFEPGCEVVADAGSKGFSLAGPVTHGADGQQGGGMSSPGGWWAVEPALGRVANGVPFRVDRLKGLGNAVVPQVVELIGRAILQARAA